MKAGFGRASALVVGVLATMACGGGATDAAVPDAERKSSVQPAAVDREPEEPTQDGASEQSETPDTSVPNEVAPERDDCVPPPAFVNRLCN